jgi:hypothetical protein
MILLAGLAGLDDDEHRPSGWLPQLSMVSNPAYKGARTVENSMLRRSLSRSIGSHRRPRCAWHDGLGTPTGLAVAPGSKSPME